MTTQPNTPELKPCPFCGSKKIELCGAGDAFCVICRNKGCGCWPFGAEEREVAINMWNTRVGEVQKGEKKIWQEMDINNLPEGEVLAANFKVGTYGCKEKLLGYLFVEPDKTITCSNDSGMLEHCTHFIDIHRYDLGVLSTRQSAEKG